MLGVERLASFYCLPNFHLTCPRSSALLKVCGSILIFNDYLKWACQTLTIMIDVPQQDIVGLSDKERAFG